MRVVGMRGLVAATVLLCASGCGQKKTAECNALIGIINNGVQSLEKAPRPANDPTGVGDLRAMATAMDRVATDAQNGPFTIPEVRKLAGDYQKMAKDIAKAERELLLAAQEKDLTKRNSAEQSLDNAVKQEDAFVDNINRYCQVQ